MKEKGDERGDGDGEKKGEGKGEEWESGIMRGRENFSTVSPFESF